jgi:hypothetical protein
MKIKAISLASVSCAFALNIASAQITISDFSAFAPSTSDATWLGGSPTAVSQFTQDVGFISITSVGGGNPTENGYFQVDTSSSPLNLTSQPNIRLNARFDAGNADTTITIAFADGDLNEAFAVFSGFTSSFSAVEVARNSFSGSVSWNDIQSWTISGGAPAGSAAVRWSVDNLAAVPEPSTYALMALGGLVLFFIARRRKAQV